MNLSQLSFVINQKDPLSLIPVVIIGGCIGILINYFSDVLPETRRLTRPLCKACHQPYSFRDYLVAIRCPKCGNRKPARFFAVIFGAILGCVLLFFFPLSNLGFWATIPIFIFMGVIAVIDIEHHAVLIQTSFFGLLLFIIYGIILNGLMKTIIGALGGFLIMLTFYFLGNIFTKLAGSLRHKDIDEVAFGFGDVFFATILGSLTGWPLIVRAIIITFLAFSSFSIVLLLVLILTKRYQAFTNAQPLTIFLILGAITAFYF